MLRPGAEVLGEFRNAFESGFGFRPEDPLASVEGLIRTVKTIKETLEPTRFRATTQDKIYEKVQDLVLAYENRSRTNDSVVQELQIIRDLCDRVEVPKGPVSVRVSWLVDRIQMLRSEVSKSRSKIDGVRAVLECAVIRRRGVIGTSDEYYKAVVRVRSEPCEFEIADVGLELRSMLDAVGWDLEPYVAKFLDRVARVLVIRSDVEQGPQGVYRLMPPG